MHDLLHRLSKNGRLLGTPLGPAVLSKNLRDLAWPVSARVAGLYRRTLARRVRAVAVVGTFGKTTTARATAAALGLAENSDIYHNARGSVAQAVFRIQPGDRYAVVEAGIARAGEMARYAATIRPDIAVVTSVGSEHQASLGSLEVTRAEKAKMVEALPSTGLAVLNGDDANVVWMRRRTAARTVTFGLGPANDVRADDVRLDWPAGMRMRLHLDGQSHDLRVRLIGRHMVRPILAAVAVARAEGLPLEPVLAALAALAPSPGRLEPVRLPSGACVLRDDVKAAGETVDAAIDVLSEVPARRRIVIMGMVTEPMGSLGPIYRRLGRRLAPLAWRILFLGSRRAMRPLSGGATGAGFDRKNLIRVTGPVLRAAELLPRDLGPGDVVLTKADSRWRLQRIALALAGRKVACDLVSCGIKGVHCGTCPMLERGWHGKETTL